MSLKGFHGQQLNGLTQAHVVTQAATQAERGQERQPRQAALLVGTQRRGESVRRFQRPQRLCGGPAEQVPQPPVGAHSSDLERGVDVVWVAGGQREDIGRGLAAGRRALQELQPAAQLIWIQRHPLAAQPDQRRLGLGKHRDFVLGERVVADGQLPAELDELVATELTGLAHHSVDRGVRGQGEPQLAAPVPPGRQQHAEPGLVEHRGRARQEPVGAVGVECELGRARGAQAGRELREDPAGTAQLGQQQLLRSVQPPAQAAVVVPRLLGGDQQARVLRRLQQELQPPRRARRRLAVVGLGVGLGQPERRPRRADHAGTDVVPRPQRLDQRIEFIGVRVEPAVRTGQRRQPILHGGPTLRAPPARRHQVDPRQRRAHRGIDHRVQRRHHQLVWVVPAEFGPAHRRHRRGE